MEHCGKSSVKKLVETAVDNKLTPAEAFHIFKQILAVIEYLHKKEICHRNIKASNIFVQKDLSIKIIDFDLASRIDQNQLQQAVCGGEAYLTEDMRTGNQYDAYKADVWASFVVLFYMVTGKYPTEGRPALSQKL